MFIQWGPPFQDHPKNQARAVSKEGQKGQSTSSWILTSTVQGHLRTNHTQNSFTPVQNVSLNHKSVWFPVAMLKTNHLSIYQCTITHVWVLIGTPHGNLLKSLATISRVRIWNKMKVNGLGRQKLGPERNSGQWAKHAWLYIFWPAPGFKGTSSVSSGFSTVGTLISVSTVRNKSLQTVGLFWNTHTHTHTHTTTQRINDFVIN